MDTFATRGRAYEPRILDGHLETLLATAGAVIIEGPRACGKTMTGMHHASSFAQLDDPRTRAFMQADPTVLLNGDTPRLLDEWQLAPDLWNLVRRAVDSRAQPGQFILTGSSVPSDDVTRHTGAGRFLRLRQRTMTWYEKLDRDPANPTVSLAALIDGQLPHPDIQSPNLDDVLRGILTSGFPALTRLDVEQQRLLMDGYLDELARTDLPRLGDIRQSPQTIRQLLASIARMTSADLRYATLAADLQTIAPGIQAETVASYVALLQRLFAIELVPPFATGLRSRAKLRTSSRLHMADPALAAAALSVGKNELAADLFTLGHLFESAVVHDLLVMTEALGGRVQHYRDSNGHEIDAILTFPKNRWAAVEIKLGGGQIADGAQSLRATVSQFDTPRPPTFLAVITGTGYTAVLEDGIVTFPLSALAP